LLSAPHAAACATRAACATQEPFFPDGVQLPRLATARLQAAGRHLKVLKRVTVVLRDPNEAYALVRKDAMLLPLPMVLLLLVCCCCCCCCCCRRCRR